MIKKIISKQHNSDMCIVCGKLSDLSLKTDFYALEDGIAYGVTTPRDEHQSYPDRMHGGMITALLDETIGRAIQVEEGDASWGVTSKIEVAFKKPVRLNRPIKCFGKIVKKYSVAFVGNGIIEDEDGILLATATATYIRMPIERMTGGDFFWEVFPDDVPATNVEITHLDELTK